MTRAKHLRRVLGSELSPTNIDGARWRGRRVCTDGLKVGTAIFRLFTPSSTGAKHFVAIHERKRAIPGGASRQATRGQHNVAGRGRGGGWGGRRAREGDCGRGQCEGLAGGARVVVGADHREQGAAIAFVHAVFMA